MRARCRVEPSHLRISSELTPRSVRLVVQLHPTSLLPYGRSEIPESYVKALENGRGQRISASEAEIMGPGYANLPSASTQ
jgi:hypothetical protein